MSNKSYGLNKEREVKKKLFSEGALDVVRSRGSFGYYDCIAFFPNYCRLISVKSTKQKYVSFNQEKKIIINHVVPNYCRKELWIYWSPNKDRVKKGWEVIQC